MKFHKLFFLVLLLLLTFQSSFGQGNSTLFDEFGALECEDFWARLDNFIVETVKDPNSVGYIVIYGKKKAILKNLRFESYANGILENIESKQLLKSEMFKKERFKIIRGKEEKDIRIQLWKSSSHSSNSFYQPATWSYVLPQTVKPFIFTAYSYGDGVCPSTSYIKLFADFLSANSNARGHLVIRDRAKQKIRQKENEVLEELISKYKVSRIQIKIFYDLDKNYPYDFTDVEFWFVPKKVSK